MIMYVHGHTKTTTTSELLLARKRIKDLKRARDAEREKAVYWQGQAEAARTERDKAVKDLSARLRATQDAYSRVLAETHADGPTVGRARLEAAAAEVRHFGPRGRRTPR